MEDLCVATVPSFAPTDQMQIQLLFQLLRHQTMPDSIYYLLEISHDFGYSLRQRLPSADSNFDPPQNLFQTRQYFLHLIQKDLISISADHTLIIIKISLSSFEVNVDIVNNMVLPPKPLLIEQKHHFQQRYTPLLDVVGNLQVKVSVFYVVVEE